jgi:hypothetical protein
MADLTQANIKDIGSIVATQIRELVPDMIRDLVPGIIHETVPDIIYAETSHIREQLDRQAGQLGQHGLVLQALQVDVRQLKTSVRKQAVLLEDLDERFKATGELS